MENNCHQWFSHTQNWNLYIFLLFLFQSFSSYFALQKQHFEFFCDPKWFEKDGLDQKYDLFMTQSSIERMVKDKKIYVTSEK